MGFILADELSCLESVSHKSSLALRVSITTALENLTMYHVRSYAPTHVVALVYSVAHVKHVGNA